MKKPLPIILAAIAVIALIFGIVSNVNGNNAKTELENQIAALKTEAETAAAAAGEELTAAKEAAAKAAEEAQGQIDDLTAKNEIFEQFKAVRDKNVYALEGDFFQKTTSMTDLIEDLHDLLGGKDREYEFFTRLE